MSWNLQGSYVETCSFDGKTGLSTSESSLAA